MARAPRSERRIKRPAGTEAEGNEKAFQPSVIHCHARGIRLFALLERIARCGSSQPATCERLHIHRGFQIVGFFYEEEKDQAAQLETRTLPKSAHARPHLRNPVRAGPRRLLPGRTERQMGLEHSRRAGKISIGQWHERQRQARCAQPAKTRPWL